MKVVEKAILSTDLALYFRKRDHFKEVANSGEIDWQEDGKKDCKEYLILYQYYGWFNVTILLSLQD